MVPLDVSRLCFPGGTLSPSPSLSPATDAELIGRLADYSFYHSIELTQGVSTPGIERYRPIQQPVLDQLRAIDCKGKRVLDVGCRDGLFAIEAERLGAREVIAIDNCLSRGAVEVVLPLLRSAVQMSERNLLDLTPDKDGRFDIILFPGVLYHLRYPFWSLKLLRDLLADDGRLLIETAVILNDPDHAMLYCPTGAESPFEPTSVTYFNLKGLRCTLESLGLKVTDASLLGHPESIDREPSPSLRQRVKRFLGRSPDRVIDRATVMCRPPTPDGRGGASERPEMGYWNGRHDLE